MNAKDEITTLQIAAILCTSTIGVSVLSLPRWAAEAAGTGAISATLIGILMHCICIFIITTAANQFPNQTFISYGNQVLGRVINGLFGFITACLFILLTAFVVREFGEVMTTTLLRSTPIQVTILVMLVTVAITTRNSLETIAYVFFYYIPFIIIPGLVLIGLAISDMEFYRLLPILGNEPSLSKLFGGGLKVISLPFFHIGMFIIILFIPLMKNSKKAYKGAAIGIVLIAFMILAMLTVSIAGFGTEQIKNEVWPVLALARIVNIPLQTLQRLDILFVVFWVISGFTTILSGYLISISALSELFSMKSHRTLSYLLLPVIFFVSLLPGNHVELYDWMLIAGKYGLLLTIGYPLLLLITGKLRRKMGGKANG